MHTMSLVDIPDTHYARTADDVYIAYKTVGDGPIDLVWQLRLGHPRLQASQPVRSVHPQLVEGGQTVPKPTVEEIGARVRTEAQDDWDQGYTWYLLTIDGSANTAYLIQWVENVGWHLEHAGWVWAERGTVGYGGFGLLNNSIIGNFLFRRPADKPVPSRVDL